MVEVGVVLVVEVVFVVVDVVVVVKVVDFVDFVVEAIAVADERRVYDVKNWFPSEDSTGYRLVYK